MFFLENSDRVYEFLTVVLNDQSCNIIELPNQKPIIWVGVCEK